MRTAAWAWLPALLVAIFAVAAVQHVGGGPSYGAAPGSAGGGCSASALQSFLGCP